MFWRSVPRSSITKPLGWISAISGCAAAVLVAVSAGAVVALGTDATGLDAASVEVALTVVGVGATAMVVAVALVVVNVGSAAIVVVVGCRVAVGSGTRAVDVTQAVSMHAASPTSVNDCQRIEWRKRRAYCGTSMRFFS
jgi:hypothetical protein